MNPTEQEQNTFRALRESEMGKTLIGYLEKIADRLCDIRTIKNLESVSSRLEVVAFLKNELIDRIKLSEISKGQEPNEYV